MNLMEFTQKLDLINIFVNTVNDESVSTMLQKHLIKSYANNFRINLTEKMIGELITN